MWEKVPLQKYLPSFYFRPVVPNLFWRIPPFAHFGTFHSFPITQLFFSFLPYHTSLQEYFVYQYIISLACPLPVLV